MDTARQVRLLLVAFVGIGCVLAASTGPADELVMRDGSRLLGKVVRMKGGAVEFETSYAGTLQVQWSEVSDLRVDAPVEMFLDNRESLQATGVHVDGESLVIELPDAGSSRIGATQLASINPERWEKGDGYRLSGQVNAGAEYQEGNTRQEKLALDGGLKVRRLHDRATFAAQYQKDSSNDVITARNWLLHSKYDYFVTDRRYYGATLDFEQDRFADLRLRTALGPHAGYQFYESERMNLGADISLLYVMDNFYVAPDDEYAALGWSLDFDRMLLADRVQFYHRHNGRVEPEDTENLVINSWTGLRFPLYSGLVASTEAQVDYDGVAPSGVDKVDTVWRLKLGYQF